MLVSMRRAIVLVCMALVLLAALVSWSVSMTMSPMTNHPTGVHATQRLADDPPNWYCPPPPKMC